MTISSIVDQYGNPISREDLIESQGGAVAYLHRHTADHPARGLTPARLARLLDDAEAGDPTAQFDLFADMEERDGHIGSEFRKLRRSVLRAPWDILPPDDATPAEAAVAKTLKSWVLQIDGLRGALFHLTDAIGKGFSALEHKWQVVNGQWRIVALTHRLQKWFQFDLQADSPRVTLSDNSARGIALKPMCWTLHQSQSSSNGIARSAMFRSLSIPYMLKNFGVSFLAEFCEVYGIPIRLGYYPSGASKDDKNSLRAALASIGRNAAGIVPDGMRIEFEKAAEGSSDPYGWLIDWCERTESKIINGSTLTAQADRNSTEALGKIHAEDFDEMVQGHGIDLGETLSRDLIWPMQQLNFGGSAARACKFVFNYEKPEDLKLFAESLPALSDIMDIPASWASKRLNLPQAVNGEAILRRRAPEVPAASARAQTQSLFSMRPILRLAAARAQAQVCCPVHDALSAVAAARANAPVQRPLSADATDQLERDTAALMDGWINEIRALVDSGAPLAEIRTKLDALVADGLPLDEMGNAMAQAMAYGNLLGRDTQRSTAL